MYNRVIKLNLPEVQEFLPHKDLINAIKTIDLGYIGSLSRDIFKAKKTSEVLELLELWLLLSDYL